jgi:poly-beta-1,6-N-acetyl-D-glucosamine synthase
MNNYNYIIISPVRNEEKYIENTVLSIISQTIKPSQWVIVNDGSIDSSRKIAEKYAKKHDWIKIVDRPDRGFTELGKGVVEAFNEGFKNISFRDWDYIVKLDCDISLDEKYFEKLLHNFNENMQLGIAGGTCYTAQKNSLYEEKVPEFHPMAAARIYSRECFKDIGGLVKTLGWDTIDLLRAQMNGWQTKRFKELKIIHYRKMASRNGLWEGKIRAGRNFYITGYHPIFLVARSIYRLKERPFLLESFGVNYGYLQAMWRREPFVVTPKEKVFLRRQQLRRLFGLKI